MAYRSQPETSSGPSGRRARCRDSHELEARRRRILLAIVHHHIEDGEPVGSRTLTEHFEIELSSASIRKIMTELTAEGYLMQPHTSAGRVPTEKAYRAYVDSVNAAFEEPPALDEGCFAASRGIESMLGRISDLLAVLSNCVGVVVAPRLGNTLFKQLRFMKLGSARVLVVLETERALIKDRVVQVSQDYSQADLDRIAHSLSQRFESRTLGQVRDALARELRDERALADRLTFEAVSLATISVQEVLEAGGLYVGGAARCLSGPEFVRVEAAQALVEALESKDRIVRLLDECLAGDEAVHVVIGSESQLEGMRDLALVAAPYGPGGRPLGSLGVLGPKRMEYARVVGLVGHVARRMTQALREVYS